MNTDLSDPDQAMTNVIEKKRGGQRNSPSTKSLSPERLANF